MRKSGRHARSVTGCLGMMALIGAVVGGGAVSAACRDDQVSVRGEFGQIRFTVEVADDDAERARGLMFREEMARGAGMLFVFDPPHEVSFWMKNTLIPLDMIFTDVAGRVVKVHSNAVPGDLTGIPGEGRVFTVLEINGGLAERYGIATGSEMQHPVYGEAAAWPCD